MVQELELEYKNAFGIPKEIILDIDGNGEVVNFDTLPPELQHDITNGVYSFEIEKTLQYL